VFLVLFPVRVNINARAKGGGTDNLSAKGKIVIFAA